MALEPLIPYFTIPELTLLRAGASETFPDLALSIKPFGALVALGAYVGSYLAIVHGKRRGFQERALMSFILWVAAFGFLFGHVLDILLYYPGQVMEDPFSLLRVWDGLSSFGGFAGALTAGLLWRLRHRVSILPYADIVASAFPVAWVFGRLGCSVAHDHPGAPSDFWLAMRYPDGGRFDLGFLELLITIPLAIGFALCWRRPRPFGFYIAVMCIYYAPLRFLLDFLRATPENAPDYTGSVDPRYAALTPAQWACVGLLALGVAHALKLARSREASLRPPEIPKAFDRSLDAEAQSTGGHAGS